MDGMYYYPDIFVRKYNKNGGRFDYYEVVNSSMIYNSIDEFVIPVGFVTNFASVPRILWPLIPPYGLAMPASVVHDFMYTTNHLQDMLGSKVARYYADDLFYRNLRETKMKKWQCVAMYLAVRWFGKGHWDRKGNTIKS